MKFILGLLFILQTTFVFAHSDQLFMSNDLSIISNKNLTNFVKIQETKTHIHIISNGIPIHRTGVFPGRGNPHSISEQRHDLKVSKNPQINMKTTQSRFFFARGCAAESYCFNFWCDIIVASGHTAMNAPDPI